MYWRPVSHTKPLPISWYLESNLPIQQFLAGNFSQAEKVIISYRNLIAESLKHATAQTIQRTDGNVEAYIQEETTRLQALAKEYEGQHKALTKHIKELREANKRFLQEIIQKHPDHAKRKEFCDRVEKEVDDIYHVEKLVSRLYMEGKDDWAKEIESCQESIEQMLDNTKLIREEETARQEVKKKRNREGSHGTVVEQLESLKHTVSDIRKGAAERIYKLLSGEHFLPFDRKDREEAISLFEPSYYELLLTYLIDRASVDKKLLLKFIEYHTDKIWLFEYLHDIYHEERQYRTTAEDAEKYVPKLFAVFSAMTQAEREYVCKEHSYRYIVEKIRDKYYAEQDLIARQQGLLFDMSPEERRANRIYVLESMLDKNMFDYFPEDNVRNGAIQYSVERIVFKDPKKKLISTRTKNKIYITKENRKEKQRDNNIVRTTFFQAILDMEKAGETNFPPDIMNVLTKIRYKCRSVYEIYPV